MASGLTVRGPGPRVAALLFVLAVVAINLPLAHSTYAGWRLDRDGVDTTATVVDLPRENAVEFRFDRDLDPEQRSYFTEVDADVYARAERDGTIPVRVLPDRPQSYEVEGRGGDPLPWVVTGVGDLMLLGFALFFWRFRPARAEQLQLVATGDVERCRPGGLLERLEDGRYVVCGDVSGIEDDAIVLDVGDRTVRVELAGHRNPVGYQQPARVIGRQR